MTLIIDLLLVALAASTGWLDATSYLRIHVFTANMTGNTVLFGLGLGRQPPGEIVPSATAIGSFLIGAFVGSWIADRATQRWEARSVLIVEIFALAVFAARWDAASPNLERERILLIALASVAMGLQQAATERLHPHPGVSTTYMSGTVERIGAGLHELLRGKPQQFVLNGSLWCVYLASAFGAALIARRDDAILGFTPLIVLLVVVAVIPFAVKRPT
jgi:uncharacterized membrane protein YoaK (UPF0700 family)